MFDSMKARQNRPLIMPNSKGVKARVNKHMLKAWLKHLSEDHHNRNYDETMRDRCVLNYVKTSHSSGVKDEIQYLEHLRSSEDGELFSQGFYSTKKLIRSIEKFQCDNHANFGWNEHYQYAFKLVSDEFATAHLEPLNYDSDESIVEAIPRLDTNGGYECYAYGVSTRKGKNLDDIYKRWRGFMNFIKAGQKLDVPIVPAYRTQGKGSAYDDDGNKTNDCSHKTRCVMMVSLSIIILECMWARPLQKWLATTRWYAGGKSLEPAISSRISEMKARFRFWTSIDYSGYDSSISDWLIYDAFKICKEAFRAVREEELYRAMVDQFVNKRIVLPSGEYVEVHRGVPSGSMFTQIIDSVVNRLMIVTYLHSKGITKYDMLIMGDDNLFYTEEEVDYNDLSSYLSHNFGVTINASKSSQGEVADPPEFLSAIWRADGRYRDPHEVIAKLLYPERFRKYEEKGFTPFDVFWAYYLCYPVVMRELFDIQRFINDHPNHCSITSLVESKAIHHIPGYMYYLYMYEMKSDGDRKLKSRYAA